MHLSSHSLEGSTLGETNTARRSHFAERWLGFIETASLGVPMQWLGCPCVQPEGVEVGAHGHRLIGRLGVILFDHCCGSMLLLSKGRGPASMLQSLKRPFQHRPRHPEPEERPRLPAQLLFRGILHLVQRRHCCCRPF